MAPKRKETPSSPPKKRVRDAAADKLNQQLKEVDECLKSAGLAPELQEMLSATLSLSLGELSDRRHKFQERLVDGIAGILGEVESSLGKKVTDARSARDEAAATQPLREKEAAAAAERLREQQGELQRLKVILAEKAMAFRATTAALAEAEAAKEADGQNAREAGNKKQDFEVALEDLTALKSFATTDASVSQKEKELMALLKRYKFEESMLIALPAALAKAPDARGQFDALAISQLEGDIGKRIAEQDAVLTAAMPSKERCEAAVGAARERLAGARGAQRVAAKAFSDAAGVRDTCEVVCTEAQKAVRELRQLLGQLDKAVHNTEAEVEAFQQGALGTFRYLRERATPAAEEPVVAPLHVVTEEAKEANAEVPVAAA